MHRAAICTAANKKLRIPLTKNEQWQRVRRVLLERRRCNASPARFQRAKTSRTRRVSWRDAETSMAQGFFHCRIAFCRNAVTRVARKFFHAKHARMTPQARRRVWKIFFHRRGPKACFRPESRSHSRESAPGDSRRCRRRGVRQPPCAKVFPARRAKIRIVKSDAREFYAGVARSAPVRGRAWP